MILTVVLLIVLRMKPLFFLKEIQLFCLGNSLKNCLSLIAFSFRPKCFYFPVFCVKTKI